MKWKNIIYMDDEKRGYDCSVFAFNFFFARHNFYSALT